MPRLDEEAQAYPLDTGPPGVGAGRARAAPTQQANLAPSFVAGHKSLAFRIRLYPDGNLTVRLVA